MNDLLKLHKTVGGNKLNKLTYREYLDEHFNLGELKDVTSINNKLEVTGDKVPLELKSPFDEDLLFYINFSQGIVQQYGDCTTSCVTPSIVDSLRGKGMSFTTANNILCLDKVVVPTEGEFTLRFKFKMLSSITKGLFFIQNNNKNAEGSGLEWSGTTLIFFNQIGNTKSTLSIPTSNIPIGSWVELVCSGNLSDFKNTVKIYINEKPITGTFSTTTITGTFSGRTTIFGGMNYGGDLTYNLNAIMDSIEIYKSIKTPSTLHYEIINKPNVLGHRISPSIQLPRNVVSSKINWEGEGKMSILPLQFNNTSHLMDSKYCTLHLDGETIKNNMNLNTTVTEIGKVATTEGVFGKNAYVIDGSTNYIQIPKESNDVGLFNSSDFTIDFWLRDKYTDYATSTIYLGIWAGDDVQSQWAITRGTTKGGIRFICRNSASSSTLIWNSSGNLIPDDEWCHIAVMRKGSTLIVTINGKVALKETNFTGNFSSTSTSPLLVGRTSHATNLYPTKCSIQEIRIHKKAIWDDLNVIPPILPSKLLEYIKVSKGEALTLDKPYLYLKQEVKGEETISNVKLEMKYKPKKEYIRPSDLKEEEEIPPKLVLYNNGDECDKVTGGWKGHQWDSSFPNGYTSKQPTYLEYGDNSNNYGDGGFVTLNDVDLTNYSKLYVDFQMTSYYAPSYTASGRVAICQTNTPDWRNKSFDVVYEVTNNTTRQQVEIDISNYNGNFYIGVEGGSGAYSNHTNIQRLYHMELRK